MSSKIKQFNEIVNGWKNLAFPNKEVEIEAKKRIQVCLECPDEKYDDNSKRCKLCGCFMPAKVRSVKSKCPLRYW